MYIILTSAARYCGRGQMPPGGPFITDAGYSVTLGQRQARPDDPELDQLGVASVQVDRADTRALLAALDGHEVVVDTVAFTPDHGAQLARLAGRAGSLVVISTGAVYQGPGLPVPVTEDWPTVQQIGRAHV